MNGAYVAHIIADRPNGPRGDPNLSDQLSGDISNLMLLCDLHHRLVDREGLAEHPTDRLRAMKMGHEARIEIATSIAPEKQSHVLLYGANVGEQASPVEFFKAARGMSPAWFPAEARGIQLGIRNSAAADHDAAFWADESRHLQRQFETQVRGRLHLGELRHLSVFAVAPQPLLVLLGSMLSDIPAAQVYQLRREPSPGWAWQDDESTDDEPFMVARPSKDGNSVALALSISARVTNERIHAVLGEDVAIWQVTIARPHNDFLRSRAQLRAFRQTVRPLLDEIKERSPRGEPIHVFPAAPVSACVELGRVHQPKAHPTLRLYDANNRLGGFVHALDVGPGMASEK
jgi:hypothetical protein